MLLELHVRNLAVLAEASVELGEGLNVLTGETGAGKSIVVDSLALLAGGRADNDLIRTGAETLSVAGVFEPAGDEWRRLLAEAGIDDGGGGELLVRREIQRSGRNRVLVNDQPTTLRLLADLAPHLLRIHGQREELGLVDPELQRVWLDASGGGAAVRLGVEVAAAWRDYADLAARLERLSGGEQVRRERLDLLRFQLSELEALEPLEGEDGELRAERDLLRNSEAVVQALGGAFAALYEDDGAAVDLVARARTLLAGAQRWVQGAAAWDAELAEVEARLSDLSAALRDRLDGLEADPARLDAVEARLASLERVLRKHGVATAAELLERRRAMALEAEELAGEGEDREGLERRVQAALSAYREAALALSEGRRSWGRDLTAAIEAELDDLGLGKARLGVELERRERPGSGLALDGTEIDFGSHGLDHVVFTFAPNPGEEPRPLARIASGGELSRIYLALQLAAHAGAAGGTEPTLVFDEVDAGVGGAQAAALGRKLRRLGARAQVLVVTHLPQVASFGHRQLRVAKEVREGRTHTRVEHLDAAAREREVARMLAGETTTELSLSHARELIAAGEGDGGATAASSAAPGGAARPRRSRR
jgi:DNA repair protein RecN (Recombination protein N)